jgi:predicted MFS family arabinose efflux permease
MLAKIAKSQATGVHEPLPEDATYVCEPPAASPASQARPWTLYSNRQRWGFLTILFLVSTSNIIDRAVISVLLDPIKHEFHVSDTMLGLLSGLGFALLYGAFGLPAARWADRGNRRTLITTALTAWSVMTVLCGCAQAWWQLMLARVGVGAAESGSQSPTQSLLADYFPPEHRAKAIAIQNSSNNIGYLLGIGLGGYIAASYGWRAAFVVSGLPGLLIALTARLSLKEPRLDLGVQASSARDERMVDAVTYIGRKRSFVYGALGLSVLTFFGYGTAMFMPSFMMRTLHASLSQVSVTWGVLISLATIIGSVAGASLCDRLSVRDVRYYAWLPAAACALAAPFYWLAFSAHSVWTFIGFDLLAESLIAATTSPIYAAIHATCGNTRRAMTFAVLYLVTILLGFGLGPLAAGALSDAFSSSFGDESLRYSLMTMTCFLIPTAAVFVYFARSLPADIEH